MYIKTSPYADILQGIRTALGVNEGIVKLCGKPGTGKTALCHQLVLELEEEGRKVVFFTGAPKTVDELQAVIVGQLGVPAGGNFTKGLSNYLLANAEANLVVVFDDAQDIDQLTFNSIRMLCNIQDDKHSLVRIVLCGADSLDRKISKPEFRALTQFLNQSFVLTPLNLDQTRDFCTAWYLAKDLQVPQDDKRVQKLLKTTGGLPGGMLDQLRQQEMLKRNEARAESDTPSQPEPPALAASTQTAEAVAQQDVMLAPIGVPVETVTFTLADTSSEPRPMVVQHDVPEPIETIEFAAAPAPAPVLTWDFVQENTLEPVPPSVTIEHEAPVQQAFVPDETSTLESPAPVSATAPGAIVVPSQTVEEIVPPVVTGQIPAGMSAPSAPVEAPVLERPAPSATPEHAEIPAPVETVEQPVELIVIEAVAQDVKAVRQPEPEIPAARTAAPAQALPASYRARGSRMIETAAVIASMVGIAAGGYFYILQARAPEPVVSQVIVREEVPVRNVDVSEQQVTVVAEPEVIVNEAPPAPELAAAPIAAAPTPEPALSATAATAVAAGARDETPAVASVSTPAANEPGAIATPVMPELAASTAAAATPATDSNKTAMLGNGEADAFISAWVGDWQSQNTEGYFSHYHTEFAPARGLSQASWREQRTQNIGRANAIVMSYDSIDIVESAPGRAVVRFWLHYRSTVYSDDTLKELELRNDDGRWRILAENNVDVRIL